MPVTIIDVTSGLIRKLLAYLEDHAAFGDLPRIIAGVLEQHTPVAHPSLDDILRVDAWSRATAKDMVALCSTS